MKQLIVIAGLAVASLLYSCSKTSTPTPPPVDTSTGTATGGNTGGGATTPGGGTTTPGGGSETTVTPQIIRAQFGNATYDEINGKLIGTDVGNDNRGGIKTGVGTIVKQELVGYEGAKVENKKGYLNMTTTDKTVLKYYQMDANGKIVAEYDLPFEAGSHFLFQGVTTKAFTDDKVVYDAAYIAKNIGKDTQAILSVAVKN